MNNKTNSIVATIIGVIVFFAVVGVVKDLVSSTPESKEEYKIPVTLEQSLVEKSDKLNSSKLKDEIVEGCLGEAVGQEPYCNCAAEYVMDNISNANLLSMGLEYEKHGTLSKEMADIMADAVYACIDKYQE